ncbi:uncharacterized protein LOC112088027 [Eutrema salsugineum]|uniref:uncharacterized protein LOC112088027 n=1 Tax=Eutrema salsugineum TaxID=72664 RepID=UPI000CED1446|nr:uncharacterized protein LOC112088027 [Eutrema salsugineum]
MNTSKGVQLEAVSVIHPPLGLKMSQESEKVEAKASTNTSVNKSDEARDSEEKEADDVDDDAHGSDDDYDPDYDFDWWNDYVLADGKGFHSKPGFDEDKDDSGSSGGCGSTRGSEPSDSNHMDNSIVLTESPIHFSGRKRTVCENVLAPHGDDDDFVQTPPVSDEMGGDFDELDLSNEDGEIWVGKKFRNKEHFKITLAINALKNIVTFEFKKHAKKYTVAECPSKICDWRVLGCQVGESALYEVRKACLTHTCHPDTRKKFSKHATSKVMAALLKSKYENAIVGPRASQLPAIVLSEYNITASYWKCWKVKEVGIYSAHGTEETSFKLLPIYLHVLKYANPGTITHLITESERDEKEGKCITRFKSVFMALAACISGWKHLKQVVVVDGTHLTGKYKGCLLTASGQDANYQVFPIAFAVVDAESDKTWRWFFEKLHGGIAKAKKKWYPQSHHGACLVHIQRNVHGKYKGSGQKGLVGKAGEAFKVSNFKKLYARLKDVDYGCWEYMEKIPLALWTRSHFSGQRYNMTSSNIAESLNNALLAPRDSPIVAMLEFIRLMLSRWLECRRETIQKMDGDITEEVDKLMNLQQQKSAALSVQGISLWEVEVSSEFGVRRLVDLLNKTCSCLEFQTLKYPCRHAMAAARLRQVEYSSLVDPILKKSIWSATVCGKILPVPDPDDIRIPAEVRDLNIMPPKAKRPSGRPTTKRKLSAGEYPQVAKKKKPKKCSRCGNAGHNRAKCKEPLG